MKKFNSGLLLAGVAAATIGFSGVAFATAPSPVQGIYSDTNVAAGALGTVPVVVTPDVAATTASTAASAGVAKAAITGSLTSQNQADIVAYNAAIAAQTAKGKALTAANTALGKATTAANDASAAKLNISNALTGAQTAATNAAADQVAKQAAYDAALLAAGGVTTAAPVVAAKADLDAAKLKSSFTAAAVTPLQTALTSAIAAETAAITTKNAATLAQVAAQNEKNLADTAVTNATATLSTGLGNNASLQLAVAAYNTAVAPVTPISGTAYNTALASIINPPAAAPAGTDWYARNTGLLAAAKASSYSYIANAAAALTDPASGARFETEVLGALGDHEVRITANTTAIAAEIVDRKAEDAAIRKEFAAADALIRKDFAAADELIRKDLVAEIAARKADTAELRDRIASSTATAIALGGTTILPDSTFTLSGNVGFYQGAQAVAMNAAARVGAKAYVTGAFGGGLNKRGELGGRVGFVFGF